MLQGIKKLLLLLPWILFRAHRLPSDLRVGARIEAVLEGQYADGPVEQGGCAQRPLNTVLKAGEPSSVTLNSNISSRQPNSNWDFHFRELSYKKYLLKRRSSLFIHGSA